MCAALSWPSYFNPLSPHGERRGAKPGEGVAFIISIHSPRMGRDVTRHAVPIGWEISIHSPRMGRDLLYLMIGLL